MAEMVNVNGQELPRHTVQFSTVASLMRLATQNAMRRAERLELGGDMAPGQAIKQELRDLRRITEEQVTYLESVLNDCYGAKGHDYNGDDRCNLCGADGRA
jgi:hypothetical protein